MIGLHFRSDNIQWILANGELFRVSGALIPDHHLTTMSQDLMLCLEAQEGVSSELFATLDTLQQEPRAMAGAQFEVH